MLTLIAAIARAIRSRVRPVRPCFTRLAWIALIWAALAPLVGACDLGAQRAAAPRIGSAPPLPPGTFRGTLVVRNDARDTSAVHPDAVTGTARWRLELDSLDWRRKVTLRLTLDDSARSVLVIRTARAEPPHGLLDVKSNASSHIDPRYYTATMVLEERGERRIYDYWDVGEDSLVFTTAESRFSGILAGTIHLRGFRPYSMRAPIGRQVASTLVGAFTATFDTVPEPVPATMTTELQTKILREALYDFAINWMNFRVNAGPADSTADNAKARAFLTSRWGEAAIIDSVAAAGRGFYVRMRGRHVPVVCVVHENTNGPACSDPRPRRWWSRIL